MDALAKDQKMQEAETAASEILTKARREKNDAEWTKALARIVHFKQALHGYEDSVRFLLETPWPEDPVGRCLLNLVAASALKNYYEAYEWEISRRETVATEDKVDIRAWTTARIFEETRSYYAAAWTQRESLGAIPVKSFPELIFRRSYPPEMRATLRDFLSYQWAEFSTNSSTWTPKESAETYKLPFADWIRSAAAAPQSEIPAKTHPLTQALLIIQDLQAWHGSMKNRSNELETKMDRLRILQTHFTRPQQKSEIESAWKTLIEKYHDLPWSASATWELARFVRDSSRYIEAHQIAMQGWKAYPSDMGGKLCKSLMAELETPRYGIENMMVDRPEARSIRITHANMKQLHFRAWRLNFDRLVAENHQKGYGTLAMNRDAQSAMIHEREPDYQWAVTLEDPGDYSDHATDSVPPMTDPGLFLVAASFNESFPKSRNRIDAVMFLVGSLVVVTSGDETQFEVQVFDGLTGDAVEGADVTLYVSGWRRQEKTRMEGRTDSEGRATFNGINNTNIFVVARKNSSVIYHQSYTGQDSQSSSAISDLIYTDRSIYRPGQTVHLKVLSFQGQDKDYAVIPGRALTVSFRDANGETIESASLTTNDFGSASATFTIPEGRALGIYRINSNNGSSNIRVEEYKRPTFEVELLKPEIDIKLNRIVSVTGRADYYFGMPVSDGEIKWRVVRKPRWPRWWWWRTNDGGSTQAFEIASGESPIKPDGTFEISFLPESDPELDKQGVTYLFEISADVTDSGGETRSGSLAVNIGYCAVEATITTVGSCFTPDQAAEIVFNRTSLDGQPRPGKGNYRIVRLVQPEQTMPASELPVPGADPVAKPLPGDQLPPRWTDEPGYARRMTDWQDGPAIDDGDLTHDETGTARLSKKLGAGTYRVHYTTVDESGTPFKSQKEFVVIGKGTELPVPLYLFTNNSILSVGQPLEIIMGSGYSGQEYWFEMSRNGKVLRRERFRDDGSARSLRVDIDETLRGGFGLKVYLVHDYAFIQSDAHIMVPWDNKQLKLEFSTFRNRLLPGGRETWQLKVRGPDSAIVAAELLAYMYDRSLDFFEAHHFPRVADIYPMYFMRFLQKWNTYQSFDRLLDENWYETVRATSYHPDQMVFHSGYGIGGPGYRDDFVMRKSGAMRNGAEPEGMALMGGAPPPPMAAPGEAKMALDGATFQNSVEIALEEPAGMAEQPVPEVEMRSDFSETAFFLPHLLSDADGNAAVEFTVPDSVTSWRVFVHAVTKDLKSGILEKETETRKDLMVRPYMPRFFREGDKGELKIVVNNAGEVPLDGKVYLEIIDPDTEQDLSTDFAPDRSALPFSVKPAESATVTFNVTAPQHLGFYAFRISATAGDLSDGELRPVPVLPGRMHLAQSRFVTLKDNDTRTMTLPDLQNSAADPTLLHDRLTITVEGQLFYHVLQALPYLVNYPHECVEQTLNRFLSTGIVSSLYKQYPALEKAANAFSERDTAWEKWNMDDPSRKMALTETPWLQTARGGDTNLPLINVLDSRIAKAQRDQAMAKLKNAQNSSGAFPWFPGGPDSPFMTLYLLYGFAKAQEFGVEIPRPMINNASRYLGDHFRGYYQKKLNTDELGVEFLVFLNYVLSCFPDESWYSDGFSEAERADILTATFGRWREVSPYCKAMLALTLHRENRPADAKLVMDSIMDSAKTKQDQGTFWAPEDRGWLWYNDSIESHAMILRALMELAPADERTDGLALWLFLNKKMNHWKSTKTTAEVMYSLAHYLSSRDALGVRETASVSAGSFRETCTFDPEVFEKGICRIDIMPEQIEPAMGEVTVEKQGKGFMFASMNWQYSTEKLPTEARGDFLSVTRQYFLRVNEGGEMVLKPLKDGTAIAVGDQVEVQLSIAAKHPMEYVHLMDPRGAGFEPEAHISGYRWDLGIVRYEEVRDSCTNFFFEWLPQGEYTFKYRIRAAMAGTFKVGPATLQSMYAPEFAAFSAGQMMEIEKMD